jgi:hypothetical protein
MRLNEILLNMYIRMRLRSAYRFISTATTEGALLVLPEGASRRDLRSRKALFRRCAMENALCWYRFANKQLERDIPNGSLVLVTGCDMTSSWGIASFADISSDMDVELKLYPSQRGTYFWETNVPSATRTGAGYESISALTRMWDRAGSMMASGSRSIDASHGTFNEINGNQTYNITNNISLTTIGGRCKL